MAMDVDGEEDATQRAAQVEDYGLEVDFDELDDDEREDSGPETERELTSAIEKLTGEIEKMAPNMKSADKCVESQFPASRATDAVMPGSETRKRG